MSLLVQQFHELHHGEQLFVLPNCWNAASAAVLQSADFPAIATSSSAVAKSLGYADREGMPFAEYLYIIRRIQSVLKVPLSVDIEMGYGRSPEAIWANVQELIALGVAGINIEDSVISNGARTLGDPTAFSTTIAFIRRQVPSSELFINVRCDTYLLGIDDARSETKIRLKAYAAAGADGLFLPCILRPDDMAAALQATTLPLNVLYMRGLPSYEALYELGVRRLSMGDYLFSDTCDHLDRLSQTIK